jgi:hypothetical protein
MDNEGFEAEVFFTTGSYAAEHHRERGFSGADLPPIAAS